MQRKITNRFKLIGAGLAASLILMGCPSPNNSSQPGGTNNNTGANASSGKATGSQVQGRTRTGGAAFDPGNADTSARGGKTLFAVYILGSDLEDDVNPRDGQADQGGESQGAGSNDLREMNAAFQAMSESERANIDVVVGFGGARNSGWKGIKYTDANCIVQDAADNNFGNDSCYAQSKSDANMGDKQTLADFVTHLKTEYPASNYGKRALILWNHGAAHAGYGPDTNFGSQGSMSISDINEALKADDKKFDIIGFDACLMGNLDVARQVKDHAHFLLASEELEPGHGWQYTDVLSYISKNPEVSAVDIGKHMVNSFVTHPDHQGAGGKTLSLVNLDKFGEVESALDNIAGQLKGGLDNQYQAILTSASKAEKYGKSAKAGSAYAMDLKHFIDRLKQEGINAGGLEQSLNNYVMYSRQDGTRPHAKGAAIYSIINKGHVQQQYYTANSSVTRGWFDFVNAFQTKGLNDDQAPTVEQAPTNTQVTQQTNEDNPAIDDSGAFGEFENFSGFEGEDAGNTDGSFDGEGEFDDLGTENFGIKQEQGLSCKDGFCFKVEDNLGVEDVLAIRVREVKPNTYQVFTELPAIEVADKTFRTPRWDGFVFHACATDACEDVVRVPLLFDDFTEDDTLIFFSDGTIDDQEVTFYIEMDENRDVLDIWAVPYEEDENGNVTQIIRDEIELKEGSRVAFYTEEYNTETDEAEYLLSEELTLGAEPSFAFIRPEGKLFTFLFAEDLKGNIQNSPLQAIK